MLTLDACSSKWICLLREAHLKESLFYIHLYKEFHAVLILLKNDKHVVDNFFIFENHVIKSSHQQSMSKIKTIFFKLL